MVKNYIIAAILGAVGSYLLIWQLFVAGGFLFFLSTLFVSNAILESIVWEMENDTKQKKAK